MADRSKLFRKPAVLARRALRGVGRRLGAALGNGVVRERASAGAAFALIFAFLIGSVDYLITGGPDWNPGTAEAAQIAAAPAATPYFIIVPEAETPQPAAPIFVVEAADYSIATEPLLGGPLDYAAVYDVDEARLYRQINAMYGDDTPMSQEPAKPISDAELERYYFGATTEPDPPKS